jgi:hypothetical protein
MLLFYAPLFVLIFCTMIGAQVGASRTRLAGADTMVGVGLAGGTLSMLAGATRIPISICIALIGAVALIGVLRLIRRGIVPGGGSFWVSILLLLPFMLTAAAAPATMWDDFFNWLPNAAYAYRFDSLARPDLPEPLAKWPGYPQTMPLLTVAASRVAGGFLESAGSVTNLVILASVAATIASTISGLGLTQAKSSVLNQVALAALILAFITLANPGFDVDILMSTYADFATAAAVAVGGLFGCLILEQMAQGQAREAWTSAARFSLVAVALVTLKQSNPALLIFLIGGLVLLAWRDPVVKVAALLRLLPVMLVPPITVWLLWRLYIVLNVPSGEMAFRSMYNWNWAEMLDMLSSIWAIYCKKPVFYLMMFGVTVGGLVALRRPKNPGSRLLSITAVCWIGYNIVLILVYLGAMTGSEAAEAAEYWRYSSHVGLLAAAAIVVYVLSTKRPVFSNRLILAVSLGALAAYPLVTVLRVKDMSPLCKEWTIHIRTVGWSLADFLPPGARVLVISGGSRDPMPFAIAYDLWRPGREDRDLRTASWEGDAPEAILKTFREGRASHLLLTGTLISTDPITVPLSLPSVGLETALFVWDGEGWHEQLRWPFNPDPDHAVGDRPCL